MQILKNKKIAILFGASGLVGGHCLTHLLESPAYEKVISFGRRTLPYNHPKLVQQEVDFDEMEEWGKLIKGNDIFICLGTTRAKAGKDGFLKVDFDYSFNAAKYAALNGADQLMLISSVGADKNSFLLYPKTKGQLEEAVTRLPFWSVHILRPSLLLGDRKEERLGEQLAIKISGLFNRFTDGLLQKYSPVEAETVAKAMIQLAQGIEGGVHVHPSHQLIEMVEEKGILNI